MSIGNDEEFEDIRIVAIDLQRSDPPGRRILELSAMEIASGDQPMLGGVIFLLDREPPEGWDACFEEAETELGYEGPFVGKLEGQTIDLNYDPERFDERFTGLKVAVANANVTYRGILAERAEHKKRAEEAAEAYRARLAAAAGRLGIPTV